MMNVAAWLFLALVWGTTWAAVKIGLETLPPMTFSGVRFALAGAVLLTASMLRGRVWPNREQWPLILATALFAVAVPYGLQFWGQQHIASGLAAVLTAMIPVLVIFMAHWSLPDEPITKRKALGAAVGLIGVASIFSDQLYSEGAMALFGSVALFAGAVASSQSQVWIKKHSRSMDPLTLATWQMTLGSLPLMILGFTQEGGWTSPTGWPLETILALAYLVIFGSAIGFVVLYWLLQRLPVTKVLTVAFANPVVAVTLGWLWLGEILSWWALAGAGGVLAGLWLILAAPPVGGAPSITEPSVTDPMVEERTPLFSSP